MWLYTLIILHLYISKYDIFIYVIYKYINEDTTYKNAFVHQQTQRALFSNPCPTVYFHNQFTENEEHRLGKEVNKAEQRRCRTLNPLRRLTKSLPELQAKRGRHLNMGVVILSVLSCLKAKCVFRNSLQSLFAFLFFSFSSLIFHYHTVSKEGNVDQELHLNLAEAHNSSRGGLALLPTPSQLDW